MPVRHAFEVIGFRLAHIMVSATRLAHVLPGFPSLREI